MFFFRALSWGDGRGLFHHGGSAFMLVFAFSFQFVATAKFRFEFPEVNN